MLDAIEIVVSGERAAPVPTFIFDTTPDYIPDAQDSALAALKFLSYVRSRIARGLPIASHLAAARRMISDLLRSTNAFDYRADDNACNLRLAFGHIKDAIAWYADATERPVLYKECSLYAIESIGDALRYISRYRQGIK